MARLAVGALVVIALLAPNPVTPGAKASNVLAVTELLKNPSFERDSDGDGIPDHWLPHNLGPDDGLVLDAFHRKFSFLIVGEQEVNKGLRQTVETPIPAGTRLEFSAYSKVEGASRHGVGGIYQVRVVLVFDDNTMTHILSPFDRGTHDWEIAGGGGQIYTKDIVRAVFSVVYNDQTGKAWFDLAHFGIGEP